MKGRSFNLLPLSSTWTVQPKDLALLRESVYCFKTVQFHNASSSLALNLLVLQPGARAPILHAEVVRHNPLPDGAKKAFGFEALRKTADLCRPGGRVENVVASRCC